MHSRDQLRRLGLRDRHSSDTAHQHTQQEGPWQPVAAVASMYPGVPAAAVPARQAQSARGGDRIPGGRPWSCKSRFPLLTKRKAMHLALARPPGEAYEGTLR